MRSFHAASMQINCLASASLDARQFGFGNVDGLLVLSTCYNLFPQDIALSYFAEICNRAMSL